MTSQASDTTKLLKRGENGSKGTSLDLSFYLFHIRPVSYQTLAKEEPFNSPKISQRLSRSGQPIRVSPVLSTPSRSQRNQCSSGESKWGTTLYLPRVNGKPGIFCLIGEGSLAGSLSVVPLPQTLTDTRDKTTTTTTTTMTNPKNKIPSELLYPPRNNQKMTWSLIAQYCLTSQTAGMYFWVCKLGTYF